MKITKKNLALVAGALAILAFIMAFLSPLKAVIGDEVIKAKATELYFEKGGTIIPFIGFLLMLVAGVYLIVRQFVNISIDKKLFYVAIALLVVGAIIVLLTKAIVIAGTIKQMGLTGATAEAAKKSMVEMYKLGTGVILGALLAILSAVVAFVAEKFIKD